MPLFFSRNYDSFIKRDGNITSSLGNNWLGNFDMTLTQNGSVVEVITNRGRLIQFERNGASWDLTGKTEIAYQLVQSGTDFILGDPYTGRIYTFDSTGKLTMIEDGNGNVHTLTYSAGTLSSVSDGLGRTLNFTYTGDQLSSIDDGTRTITFNHTGNDLTGYTDSMGNTTAYTYVTGGLMTAATRPAGNTHYLQTYDGDERVATQTDALGNTLTFSYSPPDTVMTDPLGNSRIHTHSGSGELISYQGEDGLTVSMGYGSDDRRNAITNRLGDTTTCTYHPESGKLASVTNADGTTTTYDYTARTQRQRPDAYRR
jgi:YD repeat-containing protein